MKKELLIASLMLASPAALAQGSSENPTSTTEGLSDQTSQAQWVFESEDYIRLPRYDYNAETKTVDFSHNDVIKATIHFFPVDSKSDLFDFTLYDFDPLQAGEQEFEVSFKTQDITNNREYFEVSSTYYGIKKANTVYLFDCDSTKRCDGRKGSKAFAVININENGEMTFLHTAKYFYTPYITNNRTTGESTDLGASIKYRIKN